MSKRFKIALLFFVSLLSYTFYYGRTTKTESLNCGTVARIYEQLTGYKTSHKYLMDVKFDSGYETLEVTTDTWHTSTVGERICFNQPNENYKFLVGLIFSCLVFGLILFLSWVAPLI